MDEMEEMRRSLAEAELRCRILQMESRANEAAKDTQESRAKRYREILAEVVGEGEEIKSLAQARLRCRMLEIDRDAEAAGKDSKAYRAVRHLQILSEMTGERVTNGNTRTHFIDKAVQFMTRRHPAPSTLPPVRRIQIHFVLS